MEKGKQPACSSVLLFLIRKPPSCLQRRESEMKFPPVLAKLHVMCCSRKKSWKRLKMSEHTWHTISLVWTGAALSPFRIYESQLSKHCEHTPVLGGRREKSRTRQFNWKGNLREGRDLCSSVPSARGVFFSVVISTVEARVERPRNWNLDEKKSSPRDRHRDTTRRVKYETKFLFLLA